MKENVHNVLLRSWKKFNIIQYRTELMNTDWSSLYSLEDVDLANSFLTEKVTEALDRAAPLKIIQNRSNYKSWLSDRTKSVMIERDRAREVARLTKTDRDWGLYKVLRNKCSSLQSKDKKKSEQDAFNDIAERHDTKNLFRRTRKMLNWKTGRPPLKFLMDGKLFQKAEEIANIQMDYYVKKLIKIRCSLGTTNIDPLRYLKRAFSKWKPLKNIPVFETRPVTLTETVKLIRQLSNSTSRGDDNIDSFAIKSAAEALHRPVQHVLNLSISKQKFSMRWKLGKVKPLLKSFELDQLSPGSYRPICLLPTVSKMTERVIQVQLLRHLESTGQLHRDHHAYHEKFNTTLALLQITNTIYKETDANKITSSMSLDMFAVFDCMRHDLLLKKLPYYNVGTNTCNWIKSYLEHCSTYVEIGDKCSIISPTTTGVPQGSCLGPLLYLVFMNELPESVRDANGCDNIAHQNTTELFGMECSECGCLPGYADDGIYLYSGSNRVTNQLKIKEKFKAIKDFLMSNGLLVNDGKTALTEFMSKQKRGRLKGEPPKLVVQVLEEGAVVDKTINDNKVCRFLGANLQNN